MNVKRQCSAQIAVVSTKAQIYRTSVNKTNETISTSKTIFRTMLVRNHRNSSHVLYSLYAYANRAAAQSRKIVIHRQASRAGTGCEALPKKAVVSCHGQWAPCMAGKHGWRNCGSWCDYM